MSHYYSPTSPRTPFSTRPYLPYSSPNSDPTALAFNPKRVTEGALARKLPQKPAPSTPYIHLDFHNRYGGTPQSPREDLCPVSKRGITALRYLSIALRIGQLFGAMGLLVCMLLIRKMDDWTGWVCRIPPAIAIVHNLYGVYHLSGSYRLKTPGSSKVYFLLASTLDLAILSFYAFIGVLSWRQHTASKPQWESIINDSTISAKITLTSFLLVCSSGGLTLITLFVSLYLTHCFRILANLPPDMNPFADDMGTDAKHEKRWSASTTSTTPTAFSGTRKLPFLDTRQKTKDKRRTGEHVPATPSEGKYTYQTVDIEETDLGPTNARRSEILGGGYGQVPEPSMPISLKRGSRTVRSESVHSRSEAKSVSTYETSAEIPPPGSPVSIMEDPKTSVQTFGSGVLGYSKASLYPGGREGRFRKVSAEAE